MGRSGERHWGCSMTQEQELEQLRALVIDLVAAADQDPFISIGHLLEHVLPDARRLADHARLQRDLDADVRSAGY